MAKSSKTVTPKSKPVARTEVRNSPVPKSAAPASASGASSAPAARSAGGGRPVSHELIARRAYEIWSSGQGGTDLENWIRAERELRGI